MMLEWVFIYVESLWGNGERVRWGIGYKPRKGIGEVGDVML